MDDQNKNLILATALSFAVILIWFVLFPPPEADPVPETETAVQIGEGDALATAPTTAEAQATATAQVETRQDALAEAPRVQIDTPRLTGSISLLGGRIDDLSLKDYRKTIDPDSPIVTLLSPVGTPSAYYALYGWAPGAGLLPGDVPGANTEWALESGETLGVDTPVTLTWDNGKGLTFRRELAIDDNYMFTVTQSVENASGGPASMAPYGILARHGEPQDLKNFFILHEGVVGMADGTLTETDYDDMTDFPSDTREGARAEVVQVTENGWIGFTDHYWMSTLIPAPGSAFKSVAKYDDRRDIYQTEAVLPTETVADGQTVTVTTQLFAGAKEWEALRTYETSGIQNFVDSIDWGWFFFLTKPIFWLLHNIHNLIGNMGWSIIGLTLILKALLFPLAFKSYVSMAKMKELQPQMEALKEKAGDDRQKMQQGMMELYKREKVNPAAGCLPILLQIPIFFSLYKVIFVTIELRQAPWFGPFQDLSMPDPTSIMNLFGLLPLSGPEPGTIMATIFIGILPLLLGISMWLQQKLNPAPSDPTQQMIFAWMPWVFMFMLGSFASGLVVYWIANNTITFTQQYLIMRSQGYKPDVFGNIKSGFGKKAKTEKK
ncbi:membrane protein insertase YidC [Sedimentitalea nanhaiensis]|uniref:Membrane protein insertase YidC n=1 Tax=Sedimentitalea nanhaiensis TaxID=999627 RepID=A0A1I7CMQ9_9RHOB|nr:membrane protein insertase YidC [Sedimentitalea nanhaiensis]SFU00668.1 protein translocase subunit yidC [Sedimentitalea nanhaiensis]